MIIIASLFRGYPDIGKYTDEAYNISKAEDIARLYWARNEPAIALVLTTTCVPPPYTDESNAQALVWCREFVSKADRLDCHYPKMGGLSEGMKGEVAVAEKLGIPVKYEPWDVW